MYLVAALSLSFSLRSECFTNLLTALNIIINLFWIHFIICHIFGLRWARVCVCARAFFLVKKEKWNKNGERGKQTRVFIKCREMAFEAFGYKIRVADANQIS